MKNFIARTLIVLVQGSVPGFASNYHVYPRLDPCHCGSRESQSAGTAIKPDQDRRLNGHGAVIQRQKLPTRR
jgi:hypothetical protein